MEMKSRNADSSGCSPLDNLLRSPTYPSERKTANIPAQLWIPANDPEFCGFSGTPRKQGQLTKQGKRKVEK
jgi:hypothetical protein